MANTSPNIEGLATFRKLRSQSKIEHVKKIIQHSLEYSESLNINIIAKKAGISRNFIYSNCELKELIDSLRETALIRNRRKIDQQKLTKSNANSFSKIRNITDRCKQLMNEVAALKKENINLKEHIELLN